MLIDKSQYIVALISEFAHYYRLSTVQAERYMSRFGALDFFDKHYEYLHTQSFASNVGEISAYCRKMGGSL